MPKRPEFIFAVSFKEEEGFRPDTICQNPRSFRAQDVVLASQNVVLSVVEGNPPPELLEVTSFIIGDFFAVAHGSGLYNRQIKLWEALARIVKIEVIQLTSGIFHKKQIPVFDLHMQDARGRQTVAARICPGNLTEKGINLLKLSKNFLTSQEEKPDLTGLFICLPENETAPVANYLSRLTKSNNPVAKYESVVPRLAVPLNLLSILKNPLPASEDDPLNRNIVLLLPDLHKKKGGVQAK